MPVCVKCAGNHDSKQCTLDGVDIKCHNCGENHMANDLKCPQYINYINNKNNTRKSELLKNKPNNAVCNTHSKSDNTYADVVKSSSNC